MKIEIITDLLPCPFCGGEAEIHHSGKNGRLIKCTECRIEKKAKVLKFSLEWLEDKLITDWNTRAYTPSGKEV